ncbi:hypothetical protein BTR23_09565 [Alkalihalophilus pseudofirmus]|nr:hypothetical protein BTR23_09565 [Alkalihalophilus pseudofirmus]
MSLSLPLIILFITLIIGLPVAIAFGIAGIISVYSLGLNSAIITSTLFQSIDTFPLMAIPFFILAGLLMKDGGISEKLVTWINELVGKIKGGLGAVMIIACMFFGAISGSAVATVAAIGSIMIPLMEKHGYQKRYSSALAGAAGFLGIIIPPSIPLILYGVTAGVSIGAMFLATVIPGILLTILFVIVNRFTYSKYSNSTPMWQKEVSAKGIGKSTVEALPAIFLPVLILGGIYGGIYTPTEAAAVAVVYSLFIGIFVYGSLKNIKILKNIFISSALTSASILILIAFASLLGRILTMENIPKYFSNILVETFPNQIIFLLAINIFFLLLGMFMETNVAILLFTPLLMPAIIELGIDPIHFGAILILNLGIGSVTPPFSVNLFIAGKVGGVSLLNMLKPLWPFLVFAAIPILMLTTYFPWLATWLPSLFK